MLILTRKTGERIIIGHNGEIEITLLNCKGSYNGIGVAKIGINAPDDIPIHREEIFKKIQLENEEDKHENKIRRSRNTRNTAFHDSYNR